MIHTQMIEIMREVDPIAKGQTNKQQGFKFRGIDDVYLNLHTVMAKHGVYMTSEALESHTEERTTKSGTALIYRIVKIKFTFWSEDGSSVSSIIIGEGMDSGDKAGNKAMSIAHKYCLLQAFLIPTDEIKDPDFETHEVKAMPIQVEKLPEIPVQKEQSKESIDIKQEMKSISNMLKAMGLSDSERKAIAIQIMGTLELDKLNETDVIRFREHVKSLAIHTAKKS